ncbi:hypothetical protein MLD52_03890 [Puniceicoccaceae bacterium K14]|nr:hypothetical protein [Puniceicoccaceae bacterium K14]
MIALTGGLFMAGFVVGRMTVPDFIEEGAKRENLLWPNSPSDDAEIAASHVESLPVVGRATMGTLFEGIAIQDFESIVRAAASSSDDLERESLLRVLVSEWAKKAPLAAIEFAQEIKRDDLMYEGLLRMSQLNTDDALNWIEGNVGKAGQRRYLTMAVYQGMATKDPEEAIARVEQLPAGSQRDELLSIAVNQWAKQDIQASFDWLERVELTPHFSSIYSEMMGKYIEQDPLLAASLVSDMNSSENKLSFASQVACELADQDLGYALEWVQALDGEEKKYALMGVLDRWASSSDASAALNYILEQPDEPGYQNLLETVAFKMSHNRPEELAAAMVSMNESNQIYVAQQLASVYSADDPEKCNEWLDSIQPGRVRDVAVESALKTYAYSNSSLAFRLSESINSEALRKEQMRNVLTIWMHIDFEVAEQALDASPVLTVEGKEELLNEINANLRGNDYLLPESPSS